MLLMRYNMYSGRGRQRQHRARHQFRRRDRPTSRKSVDAQLPRAMAYDWTELTYLQILAGNTAMYVFALAVVFVFLVLAGAVRKLDAAAGGDPGRADVPALLGRRRGAGADGHQHLHADRLRRAGRPGEQERDSDRRVRQAAAGSGHAALRRPRLEACRLRLRPIMMTSFAFILGVVPLVIASGAGAEMRRTLGTAVFSGMLGVTFFGIFLTPVFYYVITWFGDRPQPAATPSGPPCADAGATPEVSNEA